MKRDDGTYMCVAENAAGLRRAVAAVRVKGQTMMMMMPRNVRLENATCPGAYARFKKWGTNHGECEERGPKAGGCEEGVSPFQGSGEVAMPPPQFFLDF